MSEIEYFYAAHSAYAYLGSARFMQIARDAGRTIAHRPYDLRRAVPAVGAMPALKGWALERQAFKWAVPYHESAVKYWKEIGAWSADMDAHNNQLIERQDVLQAAWATMKGKNIADDAAFKKEWLSVRAAALEKAGLAQ